MTTSCRNPGQVESIRTKCLVGKGEAVRVALGLLLVGITLTACSPRMGSFQLPYNVMIPALPSQLEPRLAELSGVWTGTWLTPSWGSGDNSLLIIERIDHEKATVLYAWSNPLIWDEGWYRQKARVIPGPGIEWTRGSWKFTFQLTKDRRALAGTTVQAEPTENGFIAMKRTPFETFPQSRPQTSAALPRLPPAATISVPPGIPSSQARLIGIWEGTWDSGIASRLVVRGITQGKANIVYEWSSDPKGIKVSGFRRLADVSEQEGKLTWGQAPKLTFQLSADGQTLLGEWETQEMVSLATMRKVSPESGS
jgi:hypothetical protein